MPHAVKISDKLVNKAAIRARAMSRSTAGQIEYWANIGQIAEDNPDLPFTFIQDILISISHNDIQMVLHTLGFHENFYRDLNVPLNPEHR